MTGHLAELLVRHHGDLVQFVQRNAGHILRYETAEDLAQGVHLRALAAEAEFEFRGDKEFLAWLFTMARRHLVDRRKHWLAVKRDSGRVLRLTWSRGESGLRSSVTGPSTFASRREMLTLAARALAALPSRDQKLVTWAGEGVALEEQARRLDISYAACQRAGLRALERFEKTFALAAKGLKDRP